MLFHYPALMGGGSDITITITKNSTNLDVATLANNAGWNKSGKVTLIIESGVYVYATSTSGAAITVSGTFPNGVDIINNGYILGYGGQGGDATARYDKFGLPGGTALVLNSPVNITNNGTIAGGGGGGGAGGMYVNYSSGVPGGGGGGGAPLGPGGNTSGNSKKGSAGTLTAPGAGGLGSGGNNGEGYDSYYKRAGYPGTGKGASGGTYGNKGEQGTYGGGSESTARRYPGAGGAAGAYIDGNTYATWKKTGTRIGNVI